MNPASAIAAVLDDLVLVGRHGPNERLPKEEQSRCCLYAFLRQTRDVVCAERGYSSIDEGGRWECDLVALGPGKSPLWMELKHCRCARGGWQNKPSEELRNWEHDLDKLRRVPADTDRYFLLVCFTDFDPSVDLLPVHGRVIENARRFHPAQQTHQGFRPFSWRNGDGITHVGAWMWHWSAGVSIDVRA